MMETLVVNSFAGPGAGKTVASWEIAALLKKKGMCVEYVPEYAKELVWDENFEALKNQKAVTGEQTRRVKRLLGKVDIIVTDSPILLGIIYDKEKSCELKKSILETYNNLNTFNLFIQRGKNYEQSGRIQDLKQSEQIDKQIIDLLDEQKIFYGTYQQNKAELICSNILKTFHKLNNKQNVLQDELMPIEHLRIFQNTEKAILVRQDNVANSLKIWLPKSQVNINNGFVDKATQFLIVMKNLNPIKQSVRTSKP